MSAPSGWSSTPEDEGRVAGGEGEHRDAVERPAGGDHARGAHEPDRRLAADDVAERGRDPTRAGGVGAEGERDEAGGDGDARAGTRSTRHDRGIERVARCAVGRARPDETGGELIEVRLADHDRPGRDQVGRPRSPTPPAPIRERRTAGGGRRSRPRRCCPSRRTARRPARRTTGGARSRRRSASAGRVRGRRRRSRPLDRRARRCARASSSITSPRRDRRRRDSRRAARRPCAARRRSRGRATRAGARRNGATAPNTPPCIVTIFSAAS